jgi:hypothetical protein
VVSALARHVNDVIAPLVPTFLLIFNSIFCAMATAGVKYISLPVLILSLPAAYSPLTGFNVPKSRSVDLLSLLSFHNTYNRGSFGTEGVPPAGGRLFYRLPHWGFSDMRELHVFQAVV